MKALLPFLVAVGMGAGLCFAQQQEIVLGMSTALTGPVADLGQNIRLGVLAGFDRANRTGGVRGRALRLVALDDGYEPARTAPNIHRLIEVENVLAVIGDVGTPTAIAALPITQEHKTLFFAGFTGAGALRQEPPARYVINYRASYAEEIEAMVESLLTRGGLKIEDIALFTQRDGYGNAGYSAAIASLKRHGLTDENQVKHVGYQRNTLAVENALATLLYAEHPPRAVIMVGAYAPCARFITLAEESGLHALFLNVSFVGSESLAAALDSLPARVIVTQVVPQAVDASVPVVREYHEDLAKVDPHASPVCSGLEGYIAARLFVRALETIPSLPTREGVVDALERLGEFDLGLGAPLKLDARNHQASHRVWPAVYENGRFVPFQWENVGQLLSPEAQR